MDDSAREAGGDPAFDQVYERLRAVARRERRRVSASDSLNTTALVHEVYLDIRAGDGAVPVRDYFGYAARAMRNLLIDHARRYLRPKHGAGMVRTELDSQAADGVRVDAAQALELDAALNKLAQVDPRAASVVELHFFAGLELERIAELLDVSLRTINRDWRVARAWLQREMAS
ncbi:MAG: sigma-70 family RNA polymerase sigma factor [Xanthomonadales bacterium]|nr:sigma-70 family RNA polymerase sigma factor [Xanthomonadales bacterium]